jgi:hypothetical protein
MYRLTAVRAQPSASNEAKFVAIGALRMVEYLHARH